MALKRVEIKHSHGNDASIWHCRDPAAFASLRHQIVGQTDDYHIWAECDFTLRINAPGWNNFTRLIQIWKLFVVMHSQNTVSSLLESSEDLAFKCITV